MSEHPSTLAFKKFHGVDDPGGDGAFAGKLRSKAVVLRDSPPYDAILPWDELPPETRALVSVLRIPRRFQDMENSGALPATKVVNLLRALHAAELLDTVDANKARALVPIEIRKAVAEAKGQQVVRKKLVANVYRPNLEAEAAPAPAAAAQPAPSPPPAAAAPPPPPPPPTPRRESAPAASRPPASNPAPAAAATPSSAAPVDFKQLKQDVDKRFQELKKLDHFQVLELQRNATSAQVKEAYLKAVRRWHPDRASAFAGNDGVDEMRQRMQNIFSAVGEAQRVLSEQSSRTSYLEDLQRREQSGAQEQAPTRAPVRAEDAKKHGAMGAVFLKKKDFQAAMREYKRAMEFDPGIAEYKVEYAWALVLNPAVPESERKTKAGQILTELCETTRYGDAHYKLGLLHRMNNDTVRAERCFLKAAEVDPKHEEARTEVRLMDMRREKARAAAVDAKGSVLDKLKKKVTGA